MGRNLHETISQENIAWNQLLNRSVRIFKIHRITTDKQRKTSGSHPSLVLANFRSPRFFDGHTSITSNSMMARLGNPLSGTSFGWSKVIQT